MQKATLRLFNAIQIAERVPTEIPKTVLERSIRNGYILDPAIQPNEEMLSIIEGIVGISGEKANAAFHKSWTVVRDSPMELLVIQQIIHYFTTYGFESLGIYREDAVYIPCEILKLPGYHIQDDIPLTVIKAMDAQEILNCIVNLGSGIALAQETLDDIMIIIKTNTYDNGFIQKIENRELKALLYDFYDLVPSEPVEFLRHLVSKLTDESLLIKNDYLINKIKESSGKFLDVLVREAPDDLASIFFRFKPLFLAMKSISRNKTFFNSLRKKANKLHKPMPEDYLNSITAQIKHDKLDLGFLRRKMEGANIFRKIRLAYALKYRICSNNSIIYRVRNGRGWVTEFEWPNDLTRTTQQALDIVLVSIADSIQKNVEGKTFYIPSNVSYALPATEKQFTGYLPTGSYVSVPKDMIVGIHWMNTSERVDLDLSVIGESGKIGWDAAYRSEDRSILFSGDLTDAPKPNGASELFYLKEGTQETRILIVNYFNFQDNDNDEVECKILVAHEKPKNFGKNYMVDVGNIVAAANINITKEQTVLGLIANVGGQNRVYFANISIGNSITSTDSDQSAHARKYLIGSLIDSLDFGEILNMAGANIVDEKPDGKYLDFSPETLDKTTIIELIK